MTEQSSTPVQTAHGEEDCEQALERLAYNYDGAMGSLPEVIGFLSGLADVTAPFPSGTPKPIAADALMGIAGSLKDACQVIEGCEHIYHRRLKALQRDEKPSDVKPCSHKPVDLVPSRGDLLDHYTNRKPKFFHQFDGFLRQEGGYQCLGTPDDDGDMLMAGATHELMDGADVRVLIPITTTHYAAERLLQKIIDWLQREDVCDRCRVLLRDTESVVNGRIISSETSDTTPG